MTTAATAPAPIAALAAARGVHPETVRRAIRAGIVRATRTPGGAYRVRPDDLDAAFPPAESPAAPIERITMATAVSAPEAIADWLGSGVPALALIGAPHTGKSDAIRDLARTVDVTHATPDTLASRFGLAAIIDAGGVTVISGSAGFDARATTALRALIGGEPVPVERKHRPPAVTVPAVRIVIVANVEPEFAGPDAAAVRDRVQFVHLH